MAGDSHRGRTPAGNGHPQEMGTQPRGNAPSSSPPTGLRYRKAAADNESGKTNVRQNLSKRPGCSYRAPLKLGTAEGLRVKGQRAEGEPQEA